jgi:hypothetical protein
VNQVADRLDHAKLDLVIHLRHQPKVQDGQAAVWRANQVAGVRVGTALQSRQRQAGKMSTKQVGQQVLCK